MEREFIKIKVAVMLVSEAPSTLDESTAKLVVDKLSDAGHEVWPIEVVKDSEDAVRKQIDRWIDFSDVDVIVAISGFETDAMSSALAPLITKQLTGFSDLFRLLTYREIGTAAMLTEVIAAQCGHTFVFALPAARGAVATALDKLLVPQLDARTRPRNLVMRMPRHKSKVPTTGPAAFSPKEETPAGVPPPPRSMKTMPPPLPKRSPATHGTPPMPVVTVPRTISDPNIAELDPTQILEEPTSLPGISIKSLEEAIERSIETSGTELSPPPTKLDDNDPAVVAAREHAEKTPEAQAAAWVAAVEEAASKVIKRAVAEREAKLSGEHKIPELPVVEPAPDEPKVEVKAADGDEPRGKIEKASGTKQSPKPDHAVDNVAAVIVDDPDLVDKRAKAASIAPRTAKAAVEPTELPVFAARRAIPAPEKPKRGWIVVAGLALVGAVFLLINVVGKSDSTADQRPPIEPRPPAGDLASNRPPVVESPPITGGGLLTEPVAPPDAETAIEMDPTNARLPRMVPRGPRDGSANPDDPDLTKAPNNPAMTDECDEVTCVLIKYDKPCCERFRPPPVEKPPVVDPNAGPVELDKTLIKVGVERFRAMVIRCGEQTSAKGTVSISVSVKPDGNVGSASVASAPEAALGECVVGVMRKATFAKTQNGGSFTYPFAF